MEKTEKVIDLKQVNEKLIDALSTLFNSHIHNGGKVDFKEKDYSWISDDLDIIEIKYLGSEPDGDYQNELSTDGEPMMTDQEAYELLTTRLHNTYAFPHGEI